MSGLFKAGDKVRCLLGDTRGGRLRVDAIYTVGWIADGRWLHVEDEHGVQSGGWNPQRFEKVS